MKPSITYITKGMVNGASCVLLEVAVFVNDVRLHCISILFYPSGDDVISGFSGY